MRTLRKSGVRGLIVWVALAGAAVLSSCGSTSTSSSSSSTGATTASSTSEVPTVSSDSTGPVLPPAPSTLPPSLQAPCSALATALTMSEVHPRNAGNWPAERQRILTDTASNVELFSVAAKSVPTDIAKALETLKGYSTWLGKTVAESSSFDVAISAVNAYPDLVGASLATSVVDTWKRNNC